MLAAIGLPILPSPTNPTLVAIALAYEFKPKLKPPRCVPLWLQQRQPKTEGFAPFLLHSFQPAPFIMFSQLRKHENIAH
jgi:hypothetical protein